MTAFTPEVAGARGGPEWLVRRRLAADERFGALALPTEAEEIWRYSGIDRFDLDAFAPVRLAATGGREASLAHVRRLADDIGPRSALVVTSGGVVVAVEPGPTSPAGLVRVVGGGALAERLAPDMLGWGAVSDDDDQAGDAFGALHAAFVVDVLLIALSERVVLDAPVVVVHLAGDAPGVGPGAPALFPHTVIRVGPGAQAAVVEVLATAGGGSDPHASDGVALVLPVSELEVGDDAHLAYANLQLLAPGATHIGRQDSRVGRHGELRSLTVGLGGAYARVRTDSDLLAEGGRSTLLAAYLGMGEQVHDFRTLQDHHGPRTESELLFTGAVADASRSVYSGLIRIRRGARRADARQTNNNLVLSEGAHADSVPNLDIDENDVRCSHASTVGPIDEEQRYYLESRGVEPAAAERLIVQGFFAALAARSPFPGVGRFIERAVQARLAGLLPAEQADTLAAAGEGPGHG